MPLLWLSLAFLGGILLAAALSAAAQPAAVPGLHWGVWAGLGLIFVALDFFEKRAAARLGWLAAVRRVNRVGLALLLAALCAGAARYQAHTPALRTHDLAYYNENTVELRGRIDAPPDVRDNAVLLRVRVDALKPSGNTALQPVKGFVLVRLQPGQDWQYGDTLSLYGKLATPSENEEFSYRDYLAVRGIHSIMYYPSARLVEHGGGNALLSAIYALRGKAYETIERLFPQPEAGLLSGILLGLENDIPADLENAFRDTGTTHIIAISGFNIAILAGLFFGLAARLVPRIYAPLIAIPAIIAYTLLVGAQASVVRAAIMGSMALLGRQIGRQSAGANSLAFSAALMCLFNPLMPWDVGFQLSFMATLGLVLFAEPLHQRLETWAAGRFSPQTAKRLSGWVSEYFLFTLAAQVTTLPLIAYHFGRFSISSFLANILILPPQPLVMILGGAALLAGLVWLPLGKLFVMLAWPLPAYTNQMVRLLAQIPGGSLTLGEIPIWAVLAFYVLLFTLTLGRKPLRRLKERWAPELRLKPAALLVALLLAGAGIWRGVADAPDGNLHLTVLNVPDGPALLIQTPDGQALLVNGSSSASQLSSELGQRLPFLRRRLDGLVVTSRKNSALEGLPLTVERFPVKLVLWNEDAAGIRAGESLAKTLQRQSAELHWLENGERLLLGEGAQLRVLLHGSLGTALLVEWGNFCLLMPGGFSAATLLREFPNDLSGVDVIVLGEDDLENDSLLDWGALNPLVTLWRGSAGVAITGDDPHWLHLDPYAWAAFETDGAYLSASRGQ